MLRKTNGYRLLKDVIKLLDEHLNAKPQQTNKDLHEKYFDSRGKLKCETSLTYHLWEQIILIHHKESSLRPCLFTS